MKKWLCSFIVLFVNYAFAALPPFSESKKEIETILSNPEINYYIPQSDMIMQIVRTTGGYLIITNFRTVLVKVTYLPQNQVGPKQFTIEFQKAIPLVPEEAGEMEADIFTDKNSENFSE